MKHDIFINNSRCTYSMKQDNQTGHENSTLSKRTKPHSETESYRTLPSHGNEPRLYFIFLIFRFYMPVNPSFQLSSHTFFYL